MATASRTSKTVVVIRPRRALTKPQERVRRWILNHRGMLKTIAEKAGVSHQFVQRIAYGRSDAASRGMRVERMLQEAGCPGIKVR